MSSAARHAVLQRLPEGDGVPVRVTASRRAQTERPLVVTRVLGVSLAPLPSRLGRAGSPRHPLPHHPSSPRVGWDRRHRGVNLGCPFPSPVTNAGGLSWLKAPKSCLSPLGLAESERRGSAGMGAVPHSCRCAEGTALVPGSTSCSFPRPRPQRHPLQETPKASRHLRSIPPSAVPQHPVHGGTSSCLHSPVQYFLMSPHRCRAYNSSAFSGMWCFAGVRAEGLALAEPSVCAQPLRA